MSSYYTMVYDLADGSSLSLYVCEAPNELHTNELLLLAAHTCITQHYICFPPTIQDGGPGPALLLLQQGQSCDSA